MVLEEIERSLVNCSKAECFVVDNMRRVHENVFAGITGELLFETEEIVTSSSCYVNVKDVTVAHRLGSILKELLLYGKLFHPDGLTSFGFAVM